MAFRIQLVCRYTTALKADLLRWLVLDEADRLLDLGFEEDLNAILADITRRTVGIWVVQSRSFIPFDLHTRFAETDVCMNATTLFIRSVVGALYTVKSSVRSGP